MSFRLSCPVEVRFRDCDAMGHVNHAVYFTYLEIGRFAYSRELGFRDDPPYIMAHAECDFLASARTGDRLVVSLGVTKLGRTSFVMEYEITDQGRAEGGHGPDRPGGVRLREQEARPDFGGTTPQDRGVRGPSAWRARGMTMSDPQPARVLIFGKDT